MDDISGTNDNADKYITKKELSLKGGTCQQPNNNNINGKHTIEEDMSKNTTSLKLHAQSPSANTVVVVGIDLDCLQNGMDNDLINHSKQQPKLCDTCPTATITTTTTNDLNGSCVKTKPLVKSTQCGDSPLKSDNDDCVVPASDTSERSEETCSNRSTSTDNLSFMSENCLINDLILIPNLISEDEVSINSDDCIYAYRGQDADAANGAEHGRPSEDDETDFLEMDFDPDPLSEMETFPISEHNETDNCHRPTDGGSSHHHTKYHEIISGIAEHDIKIPREIDKIAEVVELNNSRTQRDVIIQRDERDAVVVTSDTNDLPNQRLDHLQMEHECNPRNAARTTPSSATQTSVAFVSHDVAQNVPVAQQQTEKYTGTKPKIKFNHKTATNVRNAYEPIDRLCDNGSLTDLTVTGGFDYNNGDEVTVEDDMQPNFYADNVTCWPESMLHNHVQYSHKKCKFNPANNHGLNCCNRRPVDENSTTKSLCCSYLIKHNSIDNRFYKKSWNNCYESMNYHKNSNDVPFDSAVDKKPKFVNIRTVGCDEKEIIDALASIELDPAVGEIREYFNYSMDTNHMNIPKYVVHKSKANCDYKYLINVIKRACRTNFISIDFIPNRMDETEMVFVSVPEILKRWTTTTDFCEILHVKNKHFKTMNVLGKLVNVIREYSNESPERYADSMITIPQYYQSGILCITKLEIEAYK